MGYSLTVDVSSLQNSVWAVTEVAWLSAFVSLRGFISGKFAGAVRDISREESQDKLGGAGRKPREVRRC